MQAKCRPDAGEMKRLTRRHFRFSNAIARAGQKYMTLREPGNRETIENY
jgi:hypothetical protein